MHLAYLSPFLEKSGLPQQRLGPPLANLSQNGRASFLNRLFNTTHRALQNTESFFNPA